MLDSQNDLYTSSHSGIPLKLLQVSEKFLLLLLDSTEKDIKIDHFCTTLHLLQASNEKNVEFLVADSDGGIDFEDNSVDLVTACQAIHWFDIPKFYSESRRVLRPGGVLAVYGYHFTGPAPSVRNHGLLTGFRDEVYQETKPYWSQRRKLVDEGYQTLEPFPLVDLKRYILHNTQ